MRGSQVPRQGQVADLIPEARAPLPSAVEMLDHEPCREPPHQVAALWDEDPHDQQQEGGKRAGARLIWGEVREGFGGLQRVKPIKAQILAAVTN